MWTVRWMGPAMRQGRTTEPSSLPASVEDVFSGSAAKSAIGKAQLALILDLFFFQKNRHNTSSFSQKMCRQFGVPPSTTSLYCSFPPPPPPSRLRGERGPQLTGGGKVSPETSPLLLNGARIRARRKSLLSHPVARGVKWTCSTEERARRRSERRKKTREENVPSSYRLEASTQHQS